MYLGSRSAKVEATGRDVSHARPRVEKSGALLGHVVLVESVTSGEEESRISLHQQEGRGRMHERRRTTSFY